MRDGLYLWENDFLNKYLTLELPRLTPRSVRTGLGPASLPCGGAAKKDLGGARGGLVHERSSALFREQQRKRRGTPSLGCMRIVFASFPDSASMEELTSFKSYELSANAWLTHA